MLRALDHSDADLTPPKTRVGAAAWNALTPHNVHLDTLAAAAAEKLGRRGVLPLAFATIAVADPIAMGTEDLRTSNPVQDWTADSVEPITLGDARRAVHDRRMRRSLPGMMMVIWGPAVSVDGVMVCFVESRHWSAATLSDGTTGGWPLAFIVETEPDVRIHHSEDEAIADMRLIGELYRPTVGLRGCSHPGGMLESTEPGELFAREMSSDEAATVSEMLRNWLVVASHYLTRSTDVVEFLELVRSRDSTGERRAMNVGERLIGSTHTNGTCFRMSLYYGDDLLPSPYFVGGHWRV